MNRRYLFKSKTLKYLLFLILLLRLFFFSNEVLDYKKTESNSVKATICDEPKRYFDKQVLVLCTDKSYKVQVTTTTFPSYNLYDKVLVKCHLDLPKNYNDFDYKKYLNKQGIYFVCYSWSIEKLNRVNLSELSFFRKIKYKLWSFKMKMASQIERKLPEPGAGLSKAIFLGLKTEVEPHLKESLENNGLAHILAISGMHIAILYTLIFFVFKKLNISNSSIKWLIGFVLLIYLVMISFSVSASRAVIMIIISFSASSLKKSLNRLYLAAFIMLIISPDLITSPAMQMSFLAVWSLLTIMPYLDYLISKRLSKINLSLRGEKYQGFKEFISRFILTLFENKYFKYFYFLFLASLAVNIMLWPLILYYFGIYNLLAVFVNILILPLVPVILVLIILGVSLGFLSFISKIFFIPLYYIFEYFYIVASSDFSAFYLKIDISIYFVLSYYLLILFYFQITKNRLRKNLLFVKNI